MTLSDKQLRALQMTGDTLQVVMAFAEYIAAELDDPESKLLCQSHAELARTCQRQLLEAFPELTGQETP
jgi:hypothetical protein